MEQLLEGIDSLSSQRSLAKDSGMLEKMDQYLENDAATPLPSKEFEEENNEVPENQDLESEIDKGVVDATGDEEKVEGFEDEMKYIENTTIN